MLKLFVLAFVLLAGPVWAQSQQVHEGLAPAWVTRSSLLPVPTDTAGLAFVRRQDVEVHLSDQGQAQYLGYRLKILQSSALQLGNLSIKWNPAAGAPIVHEIKIYRDSQVIDVLKNATFEVLRREDQLEAATLDGNLTAVFRVPDLRVGDELEVDLTTFTSDPTLGRHASGLLVLPPSPPPGRYHLGLGWDQGNKPNLKMTADMSAAMVKTESALDFRFDNPAFPSQPKDAPARYLWQHVVEYSDFADWGALSRQLAPLFEKAATLSPNSAVKLEASRIAAADATPMKRASAALKLVQQDVRYVYVGLNGGNLTPVSADETWQRRYGDCKGKTALLMALLNELGIKAEPVLVNSSGVDDGFDQRLPMPELFDHVLVRAHIDGTDYWLDGTLPPVAAPSLQPVFSVGWVLPLSSRGSSLENLVWRPATAPDEISLIEIDARSGFEKPARIVSTQINRGVKGLQEQIQFSSVSAAQLLDIYRQRATGDLLQTIDDVKWRYDQNAGASILTITGTGKISWDDDGDGARSLALPGGGFNPPEQRARTYAQNQNVPFYQKPEYACQVTTVRIPNSTLARRWTSKPGFDQHFFGRNYYRAWDLRDGSIRMVRGSRVEQPEIDSSVARHDNARIGTFDNSMGYIFYNPHDGNSSVGNGEKVPATYDFDWTADEVPCISR